MIKRYKFKDFESLVYWKPGILLDDISLKRLHLSLLKINELSGANIIHKMLDKNLSIETLREHLGNSIISLFFIAGEATAFLLSPILEYGAKPILHIGLMVIEKNPGANLMCLLFLGNLCMAYEKMGSFFITNITSTPSAVENFSEIILNAWPAPNAKLKKPPRGHKEILEKLKTSYIKNYFPDAAKIHIDYKRFILTSNSQEMGFKTNFYKVSCADNIKYNIFCRTWINYELEEDVVQIGDFNLSLYLRTHYKFWFLRQTFKTLASHTHEKNNKETNKDASRKDKKAA